MWLGSSNVALFFKLALMLWAKKATQSAHTATSGQRRAVARR
jgi:hypothetical protein